jgi:hypothetical protein
LLKKTPLLHQHVLPPQPERQGQHRPPPEDEVNGQHLDAAGQRRTQRHRRRVRDGQVNSLGGSRHRNGGSPSCDPAQKGRCGHDRRERNPEEEDGHERQDGENDAKAVLERPPADANHGLHHHSHHRRLEAVEHRIHQARFVKSGVQDGKPKNGNEAGQDEEDAGDHAAERPVEQPADVDGELLRLGAREEHAVVEGVEEALLADPALLLHQRPVHDGDLPRRPAKGEERHLRPDPDGLAQRNHGAGGAEHGGEYCTAFPEVAIHSRQLVARGPKERP